MLKITFHKKNGLIFGSKDEKTYEHLILEIMRTNLFLENKDSQDCLEIDKETEAPYTILLTVDTT